MSCCITYYGHEGAIIINEKIVVITADFRSGPQLNGNSQSFNIRWRFRKHGKLYFPGLIQLNFLCENVSEVIEYIRQISYQNRPVVIEEFGLTQALKTLAEDMTAPDEISYKTDINIEQIHLPKEMETTIYRIVQESLTNVIRHAKATAVEINLYAEGSNLHLQVRDNGSGFDVDEFFSNGHERHMGINTIKDRLEILGGKFELSSHPGSGSGFTIS